MAAVPAVPSPSPALRPAPEPDRPNLSVIATMLVIAAGVMLFAGLLASYFGSRAAADTWPPDDVALPNVPLIMTYLTLAMSSVTAQWAVAATKSGDRRQLYLAVGLTLLLGLAFVNALSFSWSQLGLVAGSSAYADAAYAVTATHLVVVVAAHVLFLVMGFRALGGHFGPRNRGFVVSAAAFWHFAVAMGAVVWISLWFLEGRPIS